MRGGLLLDLRQQRTIKANGNARRRHFDTLSTATLALALIRRSRCVHFFFLRLLLDADNRNAPSTAWTDQRYAPPAALASKFN